MSESRDGIEHLRHSDLFCALGDRELQQIAEKLKVRIYPAGAIVVREGARTDEVFIVKRGRVDVKKKEQTLGIDLTIATLRDGASFGEMALLTGRPRTATVVAAEETEVYVLERKDFEELLEKHPALAASLTRILAERLEEANQRRGLDVVSLSRLEIDIRVLTSIPEQVIARHRVLPLALTGSTLTLAMVNPADLLALDAVRKFSGGRAIEPVLMTQDDFSAFMRGRYPVLKRQASHATSEVIAPLDAADFEREILEDLQFVDDRPEGIAITDLEKEAGGAPIVRLANSIIALALKKGASDIHLEPGEKGLRVRYRIDGILNEERVLPRKVQLPLASRFKIISGLDITERRMPQDGRITVRLEDRTVDFRVSTVPAKYGEKMVLRILNRDATLLGLDQLVTDPPTRALVRDIVRKPHGIIFVTGPTGSGKTTTLYSALAELNRAEVNILTVEDPIEYDLAGINQIQVHTDIGLDFSRILRAFLRQDPDIILVGETRDRETARIAVEAALTGHLVLTTLHTNDAASAFTRLIEMDVEPFLIASSTIGVIAQRLVRKICPLCREEYTPEENTASYLGFDGGTVLSRGRGCPACSGSGYAGRVGVFEVLSMTDEVRRAVTQGRTSQETGKRAVAQGMKTLMDYARTLLLGGVTTVEEVLRTVAVDG